MRVSQHLDTHEEKVIDTLLKTMPHAKIALYNPKFHVRARVVNNLGPVEPRHHRADAQGQEECRSINFPLISLDLRLIKREIVACTVW
jgi:hypothetical protein